MIFYLTFSAMSVVWSGDPGLSCRRLAVLMFCVLAALGFARQFRPRDVASMALVISTAYLAVGLGTEIALGTFRPWQSGYRFAGTVHPNTQGVNLMVLCVASFCLARFSTPAKPRLWVLFAIGLAFLLLTKSRTSCAALAIGLSALWMVSASGRARLLTLAAGGLVICTAALVSTLFGANIEDRFTQAVMLGREEESETLTGRIPIWTELSTHLRAKPLLGYGYESFWTAPHIEAVSDEMQWPLREAHSSYIDAMLSIGLIGTAALLAAVGLGLCRSAAAYRRTADPGFAFTVCMIVCGLCDACLETGMGGPTFATLMVGSGLVQLL